MNSAKSSLKIEDFEIRIFGHQLNVRRLSHENSPSLRPLLVFLHEGLGCIEMWRDFPEDMAVLTGCDALIYDRFGHGKSDPLPFSSSSVDTEYLFRESWNFLPELLSHYGGQRYVLVGHSDGGTIALLFSAKFPEQVDGVITEAAHVFVEDLAIQGIKEAVHAYRTTDLKEKLARYHGFRLAPLFWRWADTWCSSAFRDWNIESFLKDVIAPVLVIQGEEDEYGTIHQVKSIANRVGGYAEELLIPNCRHIPHHQAREIVTREMSRFILEHCVKEKMDMRNKQPIEI